MKMLTETKIYIFIVGLLILNTFTAFAAELSLKGLEEGIRQGDVALVKVESDLPIDSISGQFDGRELVFQDDGLGQTALIGAAMNMEPGDYQLVLIDFNPQWVVKYYDELLSIFHEYPGKIREMFSSLQSGSNKILKEMRRHYVIEDVKEKLISLKKEIPDLILRTTVIIGFPGEGLGFFNPSFLFVLHD